MRDMDIRELIKAGKPVIFDGAMGTYYASLPKREAVRCESANLDYPAEIIAIHTAYLDAGCQAIKTNTFTVSADYAEGEDERGRAIIQAGCELAIKAAGPRGAMVFADIGPAPHGKSVTAGQVYVRQAEVFINSGLDYFIFETLSSDDGVAEAARYIKSRRPEAYIIVSYAVGSDAVTWEGRRGSELYAATAAIDEVDSVGFNCGSGPHHLLQFIRTLPIGEKPLSVMPNAGYPSVLGKRVVYQGQPDYYAKRMAQIAESGAAIVGGCCGTTPTHIASLSKELASPLPLRLVRRPEASKPKSGEVGDSPVWEKLNSKKRVIAVELDPPPDDDVSFFMEGVKALRSAGADMLTIADCPVGRPRADSSLLACKVHRELGIEALPHMTCRDRNLNAIKALLLGLSIEGVRNVLLVTGDPIPADDRSEVKSVFNFNSRKLARYVMSLNEGELRTPLRIFAALDVNAKNFDVQLSLAREKEAAGVECFLTQPVLSPEAMENIIRARQALSARILGGVFPVVSQRNALFLNNEISGIRVCDEIVSLYEGKSREECEALAVKISLAVAQALAPHTDGLYLITPFRRVGLMTRILEEL